ncbi:Na+/H+ antiporter NhaA [Geodermatophilus saharensis]|uniref:Na(+)/H(+) antiporter NhaA n=1 Tax=Geodermatophilus saharensis TaxID=1137994 RepID=A0A239J8A4_9ACTN|nr:Na+/H+ antiporter NhaA [Geodermatophilus saharensis]
MSAGSVPGVAADAREPMGQSAPGGRGLLARVAPLRRSLRTEAGGAGLLLVATLAALAWANSPMGDSYATFWHTEFAFRVGETELSLSLQHWVNDGLMVFFFFVVGLEIKRELVIGDLTDRRRAAVPALAAVTGLVVPALVYVVFNLGDEAVAAWGVVISTDTAFLLGVLALVGPACPAQLRLFLLTLAIADDVGALSVIALFYTEDLRLTPLAIAVLGLGLMIGLRYLHVWRGPAYLVLGLAVWVAMHESGVHPTLAGVVIALFTPAYAARREEVADAARLMRAYQQSPNPQFARAARLSIDRSVSASERLQALWQPWTSFVIVPVFALANAGVSLTGETLRDAASSPVTIGVVAGLVLGKLVGILLGTGLAVRLGLGRLAPGLTGMQLAGGAALSGIGFTISLFIVDLAFDEGQERSADQARVGVLAASVLAALLGWALFRLADRRRPSGTTRPVLLDPPVDPARDHVRGPVDAPLTLVEYGDFECPFCGRATGAVEELRERFGDRLRYVFRHVPLTDVHPHARLAAEAAEAAAAQGRFWEMHDRLFAGQDRLDPGDLLEHAAAVGLDVVRFSRDLGSGQYARRVEQDVESAEASGVEGTPTFFVGGRRHTGPYDADSLAAALLAGVGGEDALPMAPREEPGSPVLPVLGPRRREPDAVSLTRAAPLPADLEETPDRQGAYPLLTDEQLALLERHGTRRTWAPGETLFREGDPGYDFQVVLSGTVAVVEHHGHPDQRVVSVHGARRFLGELDLFSDRPVFLTAVVLQQAEVVTVPDAQVRAAFAEDHALKETVLRAFLIRRSLLLALAADVRIVGTGSSPETERLRRVAEERGLSAVVVDVEDEDDVTELLADLDVTEGDLPVVVWRSERVLRHPTEADLAALAVSSGTGATAASADARPPAQEAT